MLKVVSNGVSHFVVRSSMFYTAYPPISRDSIVSLGFCEAIPKRASVLG